MQEKIAKLLIESKHLLTLAKQLKNETQFIEPLDSGKYDPPPGIMKRVFKRLEKEYGYGIKNDVQEEP